MPYIEIPYLIIAPFVGLFDFSLYFSKLPYVAISVLSVFLLYLIARQLTGKNEAIIISLVAALNPWSIFFGRTAYEAPLAIFFFLVAFYILLVNRSF